MSYKMTCNYDVKVENCRYNTILFLKVFKAKPCKFTYILKIFLHYDRYRIFTYKRW